VTGTGPAVTASDLLDTSARRDPQARALTDGAGSWTYGELVTSSYLAAGWLHGQGVRHGDRIVLWLDGSRNFAALLYGAMRSAR
jgi:non-ribosomal peptide synthetase component E (peptide arylation enzyme)